MFDYGEKFLKKYTTILLVTLLMFTNIYGRWGWGSHRFINDAAVNHLPESMFFFEDHRDYLSVHAVDPDSDPDPGYYHYIDIDYYPEFFAGTLPHTWQGMIDLYGQDTMEDMGLVPWVIEWWLDDMTTLMADGNWNDVWQVAAELGHYVGDSHQALHLALNYNGQLSGNYGIHSRYETQMMNPRLDQISFPDSIANYWESPIDSVFDYIEDIFPLVDLIMAADDRADLATSSYNDTYYSMMWDDLGDTTIWSLSRASVDLASIWYTAWVNAGSPFPPGVVGVDDVQVPGQFQIDAFPNPFNAQVSLRFQMEEDTHASLTICDTQGRLVTPLAQGDFGRGEYSLTWNGTTQNGNDVSSGVYLFVLETPAQRHVKKLTLLK